MQVKLLKDIVSVIAGPNSVGLVDLLYGKKNINEFFIAKKLGLNINQTRNILYKLADEGLVSFVRKKDKKNGGWYTYYWTLDVSKSLGNLRNIFLREIEQMEGELKTRRQKTFYHCPNCDLEFDEERALLNNFTCPECGEVLVLRDNFELVKKIEGLLDKRREQLGIVDIELGMLQQKAVQFRQRKMKAEVKKKKAERAVKRKQRVAALKHLIRKEEAHKRKNKRKRLDLKRKSATRSKAGSRARKR